MSRSRGSRYVWQQEKSEPIAEIAIHASGRARIASSCQTRSVGRCVARRRKIPEVRWKNFTDSTPKHGPSSDTKDSALTDPDICAWCTAAPQIKIFPNTTQQFRN